jgi:hypothetical protein
MPIETGKIDEHDRIDIALAKNFFSFVSKAEKLTQFGNHFHQPYNRMLRQITIKVTARIPHRLASKSSHLDR